MRVISRCWPAPEREFRRWSGEPTFRLGAVQLELWPASMVDQHGIATVVACRSLHWIFDLLSGVFAGPAGGAIG